jgi:chemotaxis protein CheD
MYDPKLRHGGMNHFMLPTSASSEMVSTRYGDHAMRGLVERLERLGSDRRQLNASVFGGARVLFDITELMHLGRRNVEFAMEWLSDAGIAIGAQSVLGTAARRLEFDIASGACYERKLGAGA